MKLLRTEDVGDTKVEEYQVGKSTLVYVHSSKVTFDTPKKPRTTGQGSQNNHIWGHATQICNETGNDYDTVKQAVKMIAVEQMGYPYKTVAGHIVPQPESQSSTDECAKLIEAAHVLAAEIGIILQE